MATADDVRRAFEHLDLDIGWAGIAPSILPLLPRRDPSPIRTGAPLQALLGPGIPVGFGIDFGPAFATVTRDLVGRWGIDDGDVVAAALANVRALAAELPPGVVKVVPLDEEGVAQVLQSGAGWASSLLVIPDVLPRFFGPGPHLVGAPCRDVLVAFAATTPLHLALDLVEGLAWVDPVGLTPACYRHHDGTLEAVPAPLPGAVVAPGPAPAERRRFVS